MTAGIPNYLVVISYGVNKIQMKWNVFARKNLNEMTPQIDK